jgi:hypothetical protein
MLRREDVPDLSRRPNEIAETNRRGFIPVGAKKADQAILEPAEIRTDWPHEPKDKFRFWVFKGCGRTWHWDGVLAMIAEWS